MVILQFEKGDFAFSKYAKLKKKRESECFQKKLDDEEIESYTEVIKELVLMSKIDFSKSKTKITKFCEDGIYCINPKTSFLMGYFKGENCWMNTGKKVIQYDKVDNDKLYKMVILEPDEEMFENIFSEEIYDKRIKSIISNNNFIQKEIFFELQESEKVVAIDISTGECFNDIPNKAIISVFEKYFPDVDTKKLYYSMVGNYFGQMDEGFVVVLDNGKHIANINYEEVKWDFFIGFELFKKFIKSHKYVDFEKLDSFALEMYNAIFFGMIEERGIITDRYNQNYAYIEFLDGEFGIISNQKYYTGKVGEILYQISMNNYLFSVRWWYNFEEYIVEPNKNIYDVNVPISDELSIPIKITLDGEKAYISINVFYEKMPGCLSLISSDYVMVRTKVKNGVGGYVRDNAELLEKIYSYGMDKIFIEVFLNK